MIEKVLILDKTDTDGPEEKILASLVDNFSPEEVLEKLKDERWVKSGTGRTILMALGLDSDLF